MWPEPLLPAFFALFCLRPDPADLALTLLCPMRSLAAAVPAEALATLRREPVAVRTPAENRVNNSAAVVADPSSSGFNAHVLLGPDGEDLGAQAQLLVTGPEASPTITIQQDKQINHELTSAAAASAYEQVVGAAFSTCFGLSLQAGDLLLVDNRRALHCRELTPHQTRCVCASVS